MSALLHAELAGTSMSFAVPDIETVGVIAAVDPLNRGLVWLAWGADGEDDA